MMGHASARRRGLYKSPQTVAAFLHVEFSFGARMTKKAAARGSTVGIDITRQEIRDLDPQLFSEEEKKALLELLYGDPAEWTWERDLLYTYGDLQRWKLLLSEEPDSGSPYRIGHKLLMARAKHSPPESIGHAVTDFTDWVYRLYIPVKDHASLARGRRLEREIARRRIPVPKHSKWKLLHSGIAANEATVFEIPALMIDGVPMRGSPDLVFREKGSGRVLIIEIKVTEADAPSDGWPNLRAQLWAYSQIEKWKDAPEILLAGEIWGFASGLCLRKVIRWRRGEARWERENKELFETYRSFAAMHLAAQDAGRI